ncbi:MAG: Wzz/FepE/Etk N-terminal domain-containing protein [Lentisphaeraceae bacterium]|nr:Wzz/FepE/Etk N-terminal domain-containing protein [Lentisphaeraceae bacterium]
MNFKQIVYIIFLRKWLLVIPPILTCSLAIGILIFVQPIYVSSLKMWNKEMQEGSSILQVVRKGDQKDVYANVQREIIRSGVVMHKVLDELHLIEPPPSNSMAVRIFKYNPKAKKTKLNNDQRRIEALTALQKSVEVDIVNPEVVIISAKMNSPELSLRVVQSVAENYKETYLEILNREIDQFEEVLKTRLAKLEYKLRTAEQSLQAFENHNPDIVRKPEFQNRFSKLPSSSQDSLNVKTPLPSMSSDMNQVNSLTVVMHELARLEMKKSKLLTEVSDSSDLLKTINSEINRNKALLELNISKLSTQAKLAVEYQRHQWQVNLSRERYTSLLAEIDKIILSRGTKMKQIGSISVLNAATAPLYPVYPKKKMIVIAAGFFGILTGLACIYLAQIADSSFHLPKEVSSELELPVIGVIPAGDFKDA